MKNEKKNTDLDRIDVKLDKLFDGLGSLARELSGQQESTTTLWKEVRRLSDHVERIPGRMKSIIVEHEGGCLARERVRKKVLGFDSDSPRPDQSTVIVTQQAEKVKDPPAIHKWVIYISILIGAALVGGGMIIGATVFSGGNDAVRSISSKVIK